MLLHSKKTKPATVMLTDQQKHQLNVLSKQMNVSKSVILREGFDLLVKRKQYRQLLEEYNLQK